MEEENQQPFETLKDIKKIMERSSRFISLSGLSGVAAGICAIVGSWLAWKWINDYDQEGNFSNHDFNQLRTKLLLLAVSVLAVALITAFYFTWRKASHNKMPVWEHTSRRLIINMLIPFLAGGLFILAMLQYDEWRFAAPASLIFYGLALVNAGRVKFSDIKYLGAMQIALGLINMEVIGYGLYFWAAGFGLLHIVYGLLMWWKYDRK